MFYTLRVDSVMLPKFVDQVCIQYLIVQMFSQTSGPQNTLLSKLVRFLDTKDTSFDSINSMISESTTAQLVPAFAFLTYWLSTNANSDTVHVTVVQTVYHLIEMIAKKVPPVILFSGICDLNWTSRPPHVANLDYFRTTFSRLISIRSLVIPSLLNSKVLKWPKCLDQEIRSPFERYTMLSQAQSHPKYQMENARHVQRLIVNRKSLDAFKFLFKYRNSRPVITGAIILLITKLNRKRNITHRQLLFMFHTVISYTRVLSNQNEIDAQLLSEAIHDFPTVSPFLMLAIANVVPQLDQFFSFLIPPKIALGNLTEDEARREFFEHYRIVDMSTDTSMNELISEIPEIVFQYFLNPFKHNGVEMQGIGRDQHITTTITNIFKTGKSTMDKVKYVYKLASADMIDPTVLSAMNTQLCRVAVSIYTSSQKGPMNNTSPNLFKLFMNILALQTPMMGDEWATKLLVTPGEDNLDRYDSINKLIIRYGISFLVNLPIQKNLVPTLLRFMKVTDREDYLSVARLIIMKFLKSGPPRLSDAVVKALYECNDLITVLEYIDAIDGIQDLDQYEEGRRVAEIAEKLKEKLPFTFSDNPTFTITGFAPDGKVRIHEWNTTSQTIIRQMCTAESLAVFHKATNLSPELAARVWSQRNTFCVRMADYKSVIDVLCATLSNESVVSGSGTPFEIKGGEFALPVAQFALRALLVHNHEDMALVLIERMKPVLLRDSTPRHWLVHFTYRNYAWLTPRVKHALHEIVQQLPDADKYYISDGTDQVRRMIQLLHKCDMSFRQDPSTITREYQSMFDHISSYVLLSLLLKNASVEELVAQLMDPYTNFRFVIKNKEEVLCTFSRIIASLPTQISFEVFKKMMEKPVSKLIIDSMRYLLTFASFDVLKLVCVKSSELIDHDDRRLQPLMCAVMPNVTRLKSDSETATDLLCGLLSNVNTSTPIELQENVMDAVGLVYVVLKLHKSRPQLINSTIGFSPELKAIFASSLDVDVDIGKKSRNPNHSSEL